MEHHGRFIWETKEVDYVSRKHCATSRDNGSRNDGPPEKKDNLPRGQRTAPGAEPWFTLTVSKCRANEGSLEEHLPHTTRILLFSTDMTSLALHRAEGFELPTFRSRSNRRGLPRTSGKMGDVAL